MRHLIAILVCGALLLHAAIDTARQINIDARARARAKAYAAYAAGVYLEDHPDAPESTPEAIMEKYLQAMAGVDNPLMAFQRAMALLGDGGKEEKPVDGEDEEEDAADGDAPAGAVLDKEIYYPRMRQILDARPDTPYCRICLAILAMETNDAARGTSLLLNCLAEEGGHRGLAYALLGDAYMKVGDEEALRQLLRRIEGEEDLMSDYLLRLMRLRGHLRLGEREAAAEQAAAVVADETTYTHTGILSDLYDDLRKLDFPEMTDTFLEGFLLTWGDRLDDNEVERIMILRLRMAVKDGNAFLFERVVDMALEMEGLSAKFWGNCKGAASAALEAGGWGKPAGRVYANAIVRLLEMQRRMQPDKMDQLDGLRLGVYIRAGRIDEAAETALGMPLVGMDEEEQYRAALLLNQAKRSAEALSFFERLETAWSKRPPEEVERFYVLFSLSADQSGDLERSLQIMERGLKAVPESATLANALGYTLADHGRDLPRAQALVEAALKRDPKNAAYLDSIAWVHFRQGRLREAFDAIQATLAVLEEEEWDSPETDEIYGHLAAILEAMGHPVAAACWRPAE